MSQVTARRCFIKSGLAFATGLSPSILSLGATDMRAPKPGDKKGYAIGAANPEWSRMVTELNAKWVYSWTAKRPADVPGNVEWVPMIHHDSATRPAAKALSEVEAESGHKPIALLGFNEPDQKNQGDMTVEQALALWPKLEALNLPLGSPAGTHADCEWMQSFMKQAAKLKYRIDFVTVHWYGGASSAQFMSHLDKIARLYKLPIWVTEFCPADWSAGKTGKNQNAQKDVLRFIKDTLPKLERASYLHRYAWFSATPSNAALSCSALFDAEGKITPLGKAYADAG